MPLIAGGRGDADAFVQQQLTRLRVGPVCVIAYEVAGEGRFQQTVEALDIVAVSRSLVEVSYKAFRSNDEMLSYSVEPSFKRVAAARGGKASQADLVGLSHRPADVYRMRIDYKKGAGEPDAREARAPESFLRMGVSKARLSAKLGLERRLGKRALMVGLADIQR